MHASDDLYFLRFEHRPLTPEQLDQLKRAAGRAAREHRARMLRGLGIAVLASLRSAARGVRGIAHALGDGAAAVASAGWSAYAEWRERDRKSTRLNSRHLGTSYAVFCLKTRK